MKKHARLITHGLAEIFFLQDFKAGIVLVIMALVNPPAAWGGMLALASALVFARIWGLDEKGLDRFGYYIYNPLLTGMALGVCFEISPALILLIAAAGVFTLVASGVLAGGFFNLLGLPVLTLPFSLSGVVFLLAARSCPGLIPRTVFFGSGTMVDPYLPFWLAGYFKALGSVVFLPAVWAGLVIALAILLHSRLLFLFSLAGFLGGTGLKLILTGWSAAGYGGDYNVILTAMALGGVYSLPGPRSLAKAAVGVMMTVVLTDFGRLVLGGYGLPVYTFPFLIATLSSMYFDRLTGGADPGIIGLSPEKKLERAVYNSRRLTGETKGLLLPFSGEWTVWQGVDGEWTHRGIWRHAFDFVITDARGRTFSGSGLKPSDFPAYGKPVLAPCRGRVVTTVNDVPDNPIGQFNLGRRWGNLVILEHPEGWYVEISHFSPGTVRVKPGDTVQPGMLLGLCGNSGYSSQPHIHIQVQGSPDIGAGTLPFGFLCFQEKDFGLTRVIPREKQRLTPLIMGDPRPGRWEKQAETVHCFEVFEKGALIDRFEIKVSPAEGGIVLETAKGSLWLKRDDGMLTFQEPKGSDFYLKNLFLALPGLPLTGRSPLIWQDWIPARLTRSVPGQALFDVLSLFRPELTVRPVWRRLDGRVAESIVKTGNSREKNRFRLVLGNDFIFDLLETGNLLIKHLAPRPQVEAGEAEFTVPPAAGEGIYIPGRAGSAVSGRWHGLEIER